MPNLTPEERQAIREKKLQGIPIAHKKEDVQRTASENTYDSLASGKFLKFKDPGRDFQKKLREESLCRKVLLSLAYNPSLSSHSLESRLSWDQNQDELPPFDPTIDDNLRKLYAATIKVQDPETFSPILDWLYCVRYRLMPESARLPEMRDEKNKTIPTQLINETKKLLRIATSVDPVLEKIEDLRIKREAQEKLELQTSPHKLSSKDVIAQVSDIAKKKQTTPRQRY